MEYITILQENTAEVVRNILITSMKFERELVRKKLAEDKVRLGYTVSERFVYVLLHMHYIVNVGAVSITMKCGKMANSLENLTQKR